MKNELISEYDVDILYEYCEEIGFSDIEIPIHKELRYEGKGDLERVNSTTTGFAKKIGRHNYIYIEFDDFYDIDDLNWYNCDKATCLGFFVQLHVIEDGLGNIDVVTFNNPSFKLAKMIIQNKEQYA